MWEFKKQNTTGNPDALKHLGLWTNVPQERPFTREDFERLRDLPSDFPDLPCPEDDDL